LICSGTNLLNACSNETPLIDLPQHVPSPLSGGSKEGPG